MTDLKGKLALVTAAGSPIGAACAARLADAGHHVIAADTDGTAAAAVVALIRQHNGSADAGHHVIAADTDGTAAAAVVALIRQHNGSAEFAPLDASDERNWRAMAGHIRTKYKRLDVLVQAAMTLLVKPFTETTLADLRSLARDNIVAPWLGLRHCAPLLREAGNACVVNLTSTVGRTAHGGAAALSATAAGVRMMTKSAALEWGPQGYGVTVNTVNVGSVPWRPHAETTQDDLDLGPAIAPSEVAEAVLYLRSPAAKYITGMEITLDGGRSIGFPG